MNVIIAGAGEVGGHAAEVLSADGHNITVIDTSTDRLRALSETLDLRTMAGHCGHFDVLHEAGVERCDLLIAATAVDEVNMLTASLAKAAGAKSTIVRVHHTANFSLAGTSYAAHLGIDELVCPEHLTSLAIARSVRNPGSIALEEFARGRLMMQRVEVSETAGAVGKKLSELVLPTGTRLAIVERDSGPLIADADTRVEPGDYVTLVGRTDTFDTARKLFNRGKEKRINIAIMGESATSVWLCRAFKHRVFSVRIFVESHQRAEELSDKLSHVTVLEGDPTDPTTFADEHMELVDTFIAATDEDERNILACGQAKRMGVGKAIVVIQKPKYLPLLEHVGVDEAYSPRADAVKAILHLIDTGPVRSLATFANDVAEVFQITPSSRAKVLGHELRNIRLPPQSMLAALRRDERVYVPGADDQVLAGDAVLVIGPRGINNDLAKLFVTK